MRERIVVGCILIVCAGVVPAACGGTGPERPANPGPGGSGGAESGRPVRPPTGTPPTGTPPTGTPPTCTPPTGTPATGTPTSGPASPARCADGAHLIVDPARVPAAICLGVGHTVHLNTGASPYQPWGTFTSSDPGVLRCRTVRVPGGAAQADCTGRKPGTAVVTTGTTPFPGDPHGPAQQTWHLTVRVTL